MPRVRKKINQGLPVRWTFLHGAYYYRVPTGQENYWDGKRLFRLGKELPEAYKIWAEKLNANEEVKTVGELLDRYALEVIPTKAVQTQKYNQIYIKTLRSVFGRMPISAIEPIHIYLYVDKRKVKQVDKNGQERGGLSIAKREISMFSDVYTKAVQWGYVRKHPFKNEVKLETEKPRTRYVTDEELQLFLSVAPDHVKAYIQLKLLTGMRQQDLLTLKIEDLKEDGIHVTPRKTRGTSGKSTIYQWSDALIEAVEFAKASRDAHISPWLFCTRRGKCFYNEKKSTSHSWKTKWQRLMRKALEETDLKERFTEHDLRAKAASDVENLEHARQLLSHSSSKTTNRIYRRKAEVVQPAR